MQIYMKIIRCKRKFALYMVDEQGFIRYNTRQTTIKPKAKE